MASPERGRPAGGGPSGTADAIRRGSGAGARGHRRAADAQLLGEFGLQHRAGIGFGDEERAESLPALREEEAIAAAVLQRALVERDSLAERRRAAEAEIARLDARLAEYAGEAERESGLSEDAEAMQARLVEEAEAIKEAAEGHDEKLELAAEQAEEAAEALAEREEAMQVLNEAVATLAARHQAVASLVADSRKVLDRETAEAARARRRGSRRCRAASRNRAR
ncbi:hypothetical protein [Mangrovicoccus ximenensis]|uniref:hypothetical protein n=1 Tax=Mangrovicoccus ximenensis TaxID=1911570 RepID=UPI00191C2340|nr:hypothetical protein [Mangrovicoccus ximenensis]